MNNKGMTTIELVTSFALASVIFVILFNTTIALKNIYVDSGIKTNMLIEQANLSEALNTKINSHNKIEEIKVNLDKNSYNYVEYTISTIKGDYSLIIDQENKKIIFDDYTYIYSKTLSIKPNIEKYSSWTSIDKFIFMNTNLLIIDIPVYSSLFKENFGVKIVYQLNDTSINIIN